MSTATTTSLKRSRSSTPSLGTHPSTPTAEKDAIAWPDLASGEVHIKQELEHWEKIQFSFRMDDERRNQKDPDYPGDDPSRSHSYIRQHPRGRNIARTSHDPPIIPTPSPWDMSAFFPTSVYDQQSPYDVLALGAIGAVPGLDPPHPHPHPNPHAPFDPFGPPSWDLSFYPELQRPQSQAHLPPLSPAEIAQYHALMARGAAAFPPPASPSVPSSLGGSASSAPSASAPIAQAEGSTRGRSASNASRSPSQSQPTSAPTSPLDAESASAIAEDKRRRNTAASGRGRTSPYVQQC
ncbi:hypothetical protein FRC12_014044 [Ceratobasidium sp. 428]|nr:hypothetical protein FRC12_014044 [Ceratobasidium sp. 428]